MNRRFFLFGAALAPAAPVIASAPDKPKPLVAWGALDTARNDWEDAGVLWYTDPEVKVWWSESRRALVVDDPQSVNVALVAGIG